MRRGGDGRGEGVRGWARREGEKVQAPKAHEQYLRERGGGGG